MMDGLLGGHGLDRNWRIRALSTGKQPTILRSQGPLRSDARVSKKAKHLLRVEAAGIDSNSFGHSPELVSAHIKRLHAQLRAMGNCQPIARDCPHLPL